MINLQQGETLYISINVVDEDGDAITMTDTDSVFVYYDRKTTTTKVGTLTDGVFTCTLSATDTSTLLGSYNVEIKIKDNDTGDISVVYTDTMIVTKSLSPTYGIA